LSSEVAWYELVGSFWVNCNIIWSKESKNNSSEGHKLNFQRHDRTFYGGLYPRCGDEVPSLEVNTWTSCLWLLKRVFGIKTENLLGFLIYQEELRSIKIKKLLTLINWSTTTQNKGGVIDLN
jgi:hypothetical protein